jgi:hypothetical protein
MSMFQNDQPLWLPRGSIRSILALAVVGAFLFGLIDADVALLVLGFYFVGRTAAASTEAAADTTAAIVAAADSDFSQIEDPELP